VVAIEQHVRRSVSGRSNHEINVDLRSGDRLQRLLDEPGEAILQPVLGQLARHADAKGRPVSGDDRRVLEPHVVGPLGELKPKLFEHEPPPPWCLVEKSGPDFHRLAVPARPKSTIRSSPKYGSGVVRLLVACLLGIADTECGDSYWVVGLSRLCYCFRPGNITPACGYRKARRPSDEVIDAVSKDRFLA